MSDWFDGGGTGKEVDVDALMDSEAPVLIWRIVTATVCQPLAIRPP